MVELVLDRAFDDARRLGGGEPVLGLALEFRLADEHREHRRRPGHHVIARHRSRALALADALGVVLEGAQQRAAQAGLVGAAVAGRNGIAIGGDEAVGVGDPGDRPFDGAVGARPARLSGEDVGMDEDLPGHGGEEIVLEAVGEVEALLLRHALDAVQKLLVAMPADFDAAEQIRLGARHLEQALRVELRLAAENLRVRLEAHLGAAPVGRAPELLEAALGNAALERLPIELAAGRDLDLEPLRERVHHGDADAVQAARGLVDLGVELAAGVERAHHHFEGGLLREFRMRIDRDAAAVVGDGEVAVGLKLDLDEGRVAGERLVHGVVDHLGEQVMERLLVGAADIHAGPPAHRLEAFQHLDVVGGIGVAVAVAGRLAALCPRCRTFREQVAGRRRLLR